MKKKIVLIAALLIVITVGSVTYFKPKNKDKDLVEFLHQAGFDQIPSLQSFDYSQEKKYWFDKFGVYFISYAEMDSLCKLNNFIVGEASRYKEDIPMDAIKEMNKNYDTLKDEMVTYGFRTNGQLIAPPDMYFSKSEVGYWLKDKTNMNDFEVHLVSSDLEDRLSDKGVKVMKANYYKTHVDDWELIKNNSFSKVYVVSDARKFNTEGMTIVNNILVPQKRDPIAVLKHRKGYLILAKW